MLPGGTFMLLSQITIVHHSGRIGSNIGQKVSHYDRKLEWRGNIVISSSVAKITYIHTWWVKVAYLSQRKCFFFFCCRPDNRCKCWLGVVHAERVSTINSHFGRALIPFFNLKQYLLKEICSFQNNFDKYK